MKKLESEVKSILEGITSPDIVDAIIINFVNSFSFASKPSKDRLEVFCVKMVQDLPSSKT